MGGACSCLFELTNQSRLALKRQALEQKRSDRWWIKSGNKSRCTWLIKPEWHDGEKLWQDSSLLYWGAIVVGGASSSCQPIKRLLLKNQVIESDKTLRFQWQIIMKETATERERDGGITTTVGFTCNDLVSVVFTTLNMGFVCVCVCVGLWVWVCVCVHLPQLQETRQQTDRWYESVFKAFIILISLYF